MSDDAFTKGRYPACPTAQTDRLPVQRPLPSPPRSTPQREPRPVPPATTRRECQTDHPTVAEEQERLWVQERLDRLHRRENGGIGAAGIVAGLVVYVAGTAALAMVLWVLL